VIATAKHTGGAGASPAPTVSVISTVLAAVVYGGLPRKILMAKRTANAFVTRYKMSYTCPIRQMGSLFVASNIERAAGWRLWLEGTRPINNNMEGTRPPTGASPTQPYKCGQYFKVKVKIEIALVLTLILTLTF
jgi:hypothetical protein